MMIYEDSVEEQNSEWEKLGKRKQTTPLDSGTLKKQKTFPHTSASRVVRIITPYESIVATLARLNSNTLADTEVDDNEILAFLKIKLKNSLCVFVSNQPWKLQIEKAEKAIYFKQTTFPLIDFFKDFLADDANTTFVLPLMPNSAHHCGLIIRKKTMGNSTQLNYAYINPETSAAIISATDNDVLREIQASNELIFELLQEINTVPAGQSYVFDTPDKSSLAANAIQSIKKLNLQNQKWFMIDNLSCKQQINNRDCGYIVGQTLYELAAQLPLSILPNDASNLEASIESIAQARANFGAEEIIGIDEVEVYIKRQYYQRLAKAMAGIGDGTKEFWDYIKNIGLQKNNELVINPHLISELIGFIKIYNLKDNKRYLELEGSFKEDKLFNYLNNSRILAGVAVEKIKKTCDNLLQFQIDANHQQNIYYVLHANRKAHPLSGVPSDEISPTISMIPKLKPKANTPQTKVLAQSNLKLADKNANQSTSSIKLTIELVPKTCWFDNVRTHITPHYWKKLCKVTYEKANHQCEICTSTAGKPHKLECHEIWDYDDELKIQKLVGLIALCPPCHEVKHIGLAGTKGRTAIVAKHLAAINNWGLEQTNAYINTAFLVWGERSQHPWKLDASWIEGQGIQVRKKEPKAKREQKQHLPEFKKAIEEKNIEKIKLILLSVSEKDIQKSVYHPSNKYKHNPIHVAVMSDDIRFLESLLDIPQLQPYINKADKYHETPLFHAVKDKKMDRVKMLFAHGADVLHLSKGKKTLLHYAVNNKDVECIKLLLGHGATELCHQYSSWDKLPFHAVCLIDIEESVRGNINTDKINSICDLLVPYLSNAEITKIDKYGKTLLHYAVSVLSKRHIKYLLENGAREVLHAADKYGKTVLHQTAKWGNVGALKVLLAHGIKNLINKVDYCGKSALHEAAIYVRVEVIKILLEHGAEFDKKSASGNLTAFEEAINKLGVAKAFAIFSPYMKKTEEEEQAYLNELLQTYPSLIAQGVFSHDCLAKKRNRPDEFLEDTHANKKSKTMVSDGLLASNYECKSTFIGHNKAIYCLAVLDERRVVSGAWDNTLKVWALSGSENAKCEQTLRGHNNYDFIFAVAVFPDKRLVSGGSDSLVRIWNLTRPEGRKCERILMGHRSWIRGVAASSDEIVVSASDDKTLKVWDLSKPEGLECKRTLEGHDDFVLSVIVSPLSTYLVISTSEDKTLKLWDLTRPKGQECIRTLVGHTGPVVSAAFLPDNRVVSASWDNTLRVWNLTEPEGSECEQVLTGHSDGVLSVRVLSNNKLASGSSDGVIKVWELNNHNRFECTQTLIAHQEGVLGIVELLNHLIVSASDDKTLKIWRDKNQLEPENENIIAAIEPLITDCLPEETFKVKQRFSKELSLNIITNGNWFEFSGNLTLNDGDVVSMQVLLAALSRQSYGQYLCLEDGEFIKLSSQLKEQLTLLHAISDGNRINSLNAQILSDIVANAENTTFDAGWEAHLQKIQTMKTHTPKVPTTLQATLRDYQIEGFQYLSRLTHCGIGACLADDMGLGKTVQTIALLLERAHYGASLVIAPTSVGFNWIEELNKFAPTLRVYNLRVTERAIVIEEASHFDVVICSYGLLQHNHELLTKKRWEVIVLDEAQAIKNANTQRWKAVMALQGNGRIALSGTPIENHLGELWSIFSFINPGLLGPFKLFQQKYLIPIETQQSPEKMQALKALVSPYILRRLKSEVLSELPSKIEQTIYVEQTEEEAKFYEALRRKAEQRVSYFIQENNHLAVLAEITKLRLACCDSSLVDKSLHIENSKLNSFIKLCKNIIDSGHKALVFSQFVSFLEIVKKRIEEEKFSYQYLDGSTSPANRKKSVEAFQAGEGDLFLLSLKAGGSGLNLTAANYVIHLDPWWNPAVEDQASDRAYRIGQQRSVTVYRFIMKNTIEEKIVGLHTRKRNIASELLSEQGISSKLSNEDLMCLIGDNKESTPNDLPHFPENQIIQILPRVENSNSLEHDQKLNQCPAQNTTIPLQKPQKIFGNQANFFKPKKLFLPAYECENILKAHDKNIYGICYFSDHCVISASLDKTLKVWDLTMPEDEKCVSTLEGHSQQVLGIAVFDVNLIISASMDNTLKVWDLRKPTGLKCARTLIGHTHWVYCVAVLPNNCVVSASEDTTLKVWNLTNPQGSECVRTLVGHKGAVLSVAVLADGRIVSTSEDKSIKLWDLSKPPGSECVLTLCGHGDLIWCVVVLSDNVFASGSEDGLIKLWNLSEPSGKECVRTLKGHSKLVRSIARISDSQIISASEDGFLKVWDLNKPEGFECVQTLEGHGHSVLSVTVLPDNRAISGASDGSLKVWRDKNQLKLTSEKEKNQKILTSEKDALMPPLEKNAIAKTSLLPSQAGREQYGSWIREKSHISHEVDRSKSGKWMLFYSSSDVDIAWHLVKQGIQDGNLWEAKVSTSDNTEKHVIIIYTKNFEDIKDVVRVHDYLTEVGLKNKKVIYYKTDNQTRAGIYSGMFQQKPWIYNSLMIKKLREQSSPETEISSQDSIFSFKGKY